MKDTSIRMFLFCSISALAAVVISRHVSAEMSLRSAAIVSLAQLDAGAYNQSVLSRRLREMPLKASDLRTACVMIGRASDTAVELDPKALEGCGIDMNVPVQFDVRTGTLRQILDGLVQKIQTQPAQLAYRINGERVLISTIDELSKNTTTEIYNLRPLIEKVVHQGAASRITPEDAINEINHLIVDTVSSDSWREAGGHVGSMHEVGGLLVVEQTPETHQAIARLLLQLDKRMKP